VSGALLYCQQVNIAERLHARGIHDILDVLQTGVTFIGQKMDRNLLDPGLPYRALEALRLLCLLLEECVGDDSLPDAEILDCARERECDPIHADPDAKTKRSDILD